MKRGALARAACASACVALILPHVARAQTTAQQATPSQATQSPTKPSAADIEEAKKHYARGVQLYNQRADAAALAELERAYALAPNWKILYNLGLVELQMNDFASALRSFELYLLEGGTAMGPARRSEVEGRIRQLRDQVATIDVRVNVGAAEIALDDVAVGSAPLAKPLVVNPGHHKLGASGAGRVATSKVLSVAGGDHVTVELALEEAAPVAPIVPAPAPVAAPAPAAIPPSGAAEPVPLPPQNAEAPRSSNAMWIGWVTTGALVAGAVATGIVALSANQELTRAKEDGPTPGAELDRLSSRARSFAIASDVLTGAAIVAGGISIYLTLQRRRAPDATAAVKAVKTGGIETRIELGAGSAALRGVF